MHCSVCKKFWAPQAESVAVLLWALVCTAAVGQVVREK